MKYSKLDLAIVFITLTHVVGLIVGAYYFDDLNNLGILFLAALHFLGYQYAWGVCAHQASHYDLFLHRRLNIIFSFMQTLSLDKSTMIYKAGHLNHHQYNNGPKDYDSIYANGENGKVEGLWSYCVIGTAIFVKNIFSWSRSNKCLEDTRRFRKFEQAVWEQRFRYFFYSLLILINYKFFLFLYLPIGLISKIGTSMQGYAEHAYSKPNFDAIEGTNSCYDRFYNILTFNNGYHAEHHYKASAHWTMMPEVRRNMEDRFPNKRPRVVRGCHLFGLLQKRYVSPSSNDHRDINQAEPDEPGRNFRAS